MDAALAKVRWDQEMANLRRVASEWGSAEISVDGTTVQVHVPHPEKRLLLQARCEGYPEIPPSYSFLNPDTRRDEGADYWPHDGGGAFKTDEAPPWICLPGTREHKDHHPDYRYDPFRDSISGVFLSVLRLSR